MSAKTRRQTSSSRVSISDTGPGINHIPNIIGAEQCDRTRAERESYFRVSDDTLRKGILSRLT